MEVFLNLQTPSEIMLKLQTSPENHNSLLLPKQPVETEADFERLLTYKIEYSDAIVNYEDSEEEYINAFSHLNKINSIVKIEDNSIESFKNSLKLAKQDYDNKLNKLGDAKDWLNKLENKILNIEKKIKSIDI